MTTTSSFKVSFTLRTKKKNPEIATIYCRISVNGKRIEFALVKDIPSASWNSRKEKVSHVYKDFRKTNTYIEEVKAKLTNIHRELTINEKAISPLVIKNHFFGVKEKGHLLSYLCDYHFKSQSAILSAGTVAHYNTTVKYLNEFLKKKRNVDDILLKEIDYGFITDFAAFLHTRIPTDHQKPMSHNVVMKHLTRFRKLLNLASKLEWIQKKPFDRFQISYTKVDRGHLTNEELQTIINKDIRIERLMYIRDLFVFSCYTGLAYIDVSNLKPENIVLGIDGNYWIHSKRKKTNVAIHVPLLPIALDIINKYRDNVKSLHHGLIFPLISNQRLNSYLKEIADICGINKNFTFHLARHTFATSIALSNGVPIETVSKMLGHTKLSTTQIYAKVLENKISSDMNDLKEKLYSGSDKINKCSNI